MISLAPRFTSLRRTASRTMARKAPVYGSDLTCSVRSTDLPARSRPSLREPSHSPAASTALSQLMDYGTATSSRDKAPASARGAVCAKAKVAVQPSCISPAWCVIGAAVLFPDLCESCLDGLFRSHRFSQGAWRAFLRVIPLSSGFIRLSHSSFKGAPGLLHALPAPPG